MNSNDEDKKERPWLEKYPSTVMYVKEVWVSNDVVLSDETDSHYSGEFHEIKITDNSGGIFKCGGVFRGCIAKELSQLIRSGKTYKLWHTQHHGRLKILNVQIIL